MPANSGGTDQLRRDKNAILNREQHRRAIQLSQQNIDEMSNINKIQGYRQFYDVSEANAENLKIAQMLETPDEVHFPKEDKADLLIAGRRNLNFIFANMEKMGGDSELMHNIKTNLYDYENLLAMNVIQSHENNLRDMLNATIAKSQTVIDFCNTYIQRGRSMFIWRWGRFDAVRKLKERTEEEQKILTSLSNSQQIELIQEHLTGKERVSDLLNTLRYEGKIKKKLMAERRTRNTNLRSASTQAEDRIKTKEQEVSDQILKDLKAEIGNEKEIKLNKSDVEAVSAMVGLNKLALKDAAKFYKILNKNVDFDLRPDSIHLRKDINEKLGLSRDPVGGQEPPVTEEEQRKYDEELEKNKQEKQEKIECMEQMFDVIQSFDMKQLNIDKLEDLFSEKYDQVIMLRKLCLAAEGMLPSYAHEFNYEDSEIPQKYNREQQAKLKTRIECVKNASVLYMNTQKILKSTAADTVDLDACFTKGRNYIEKAIQKEEDTEKEHVYRLMLETFVKLYSHDLEKVAYGPGIDIEALLDNEIEKMRMEMLEGDLGNFNEPKKIKKKQEEKKKEEDYNKQLDAYNKDLNKYKEDYKTYFLRELEIRKAQKKEFEEEEKRRKQENKSATYSAKMQMIYSNADIVHQRIAENKEYQKQIFDAVGDAIACLMQEQLDSGKLITVNDMPLWKELAQDPKKFFAEKKINGKRIRLWSMMQKEYNIDLLCRKFESKPEEQLNPLEKQFVAAVHIRHLLARINKEHLGLKWDAKDEANFRKIPKELFNKIGKNLESLTGTTAASEDILKKWKEFDKLNVDEAAQLLKELWTKVGGHTESVLPSIQTFTPEDGFESIEVAENLLLQAIKAANIKEGETVSSLEYPKQWHFKSIPQMYAKQLDLSELKKPGFKGKPPVNPNAPEEEKVLLNRQDWTVYDFKEELIKEYAAELKSVGWEPKIEKPKTARI